MKHVKTFEVVTTRFNEPQSEEPIEFEFGDIVRFKSDANVSSGIKSAIYQVEATAMGKSKLVNLEDSDYLGWIRNFNLELLSDEEIAELKK
jgi:hypothetical protein